MNKVMKKTSKRIIAFMICLCLLVNTYLPLFKVFAITNDEKPNYVEISLRRATGVTINDNTATISYDNGTVTVSGENLDYDVENNHDFGNNVYGPLYRLYTSSSSLTFTAHPQDNYTVEGRENGQLLELVNNEYEKDGLQIKSDKPEGYDIEFSFMESQPDPGPGSGPGPQPQGNTHATINLSAGEGNYQVTYHDYEGQEHIEYHPYENTADIAINDNYISSYDLVNGSGELNYDSNELDTTVKFTFSTLWHQKFFDTIVINNVSYNVAQYLDYDDRDALLEANQASQVVAFDIPNVAKADTYDIVVKVGKNENGYIGNFLWTADPDQQYERDEHGEIIYENGVPVPGRDYIGNSTLELVKAVYTVHGQEYTVTEDDIAAHIDDYHVLVRIDDQRNVGCDLQLGCRRIRKIYSSS